MTQAELQKENENLKAIIKEGKQHFQFLNDVLGIEKKLDNMGLMLALPGIIRKVQTQPEIFEKLTEYLQKINNLNLN